MSEDAAVILARHRQVTETPLRKERGTVVLRYHYSGQGLTGTVLSTFDLATGRYVTEADIPPVAAADGYDGKVPWMRELSRKATLQEGGDRVALAVNEAYRNANGWWRADHGGGLIERADGDADGDHLRVTPAGGKPFEAWFDPQSGHLVKIAETRGSQATEVRYSGFEHRAGLIVPTTISTRVGGEEQLLTLADARVERARPATAFRGASTAPKDWSLPPQGRVTVPFRLLNNHVFVDVMVNGRGPYPFIVDTGGHNIITPATLGEAGLRQEGATSSGGAGANTVPTGYVRVPEIRVGDMVLRDQTMTTLEFSTKPVEGITVGGMIGFETFLRFIAVMDYGASTLTLVDPSRFTAAERSTAGTRVPFVFYDHIPQVTGQFDGIPARFNIDTGARNEVTATRPFVERFRLRERLPNGIEAIDGWGVGGPGRSYVVRAPWMSLGSVRIDAPVAGLAQANRGAFSDSNYEGNVGSGLLKRFVATFDYFKQDMYLKPVPDPSEDIGTFDRVGLWINLADRGFEVMDVATGSPAEGAGIRIGDVVTAIDGSGMRDLSLSDARRRFRTARIDRDLSLRITRGSGERTVTIRPRDQIEPAFAGNP